MKKNLFILSFILVSCVSQKVVYKTDDIKVSSSEQTYPITVGVQLFSDLRQQSDGDKALFDNKREIKLNGKRTCINAEKHYKKDSVVMQFTRMFVEHLNRSNIFHTAYVCEANTKDYYITGNLKGFAGVQAFSTKAYVGAQFGLIGALATAGAKTPANIKIEITNLKLHKPNGEIIKDFGDFSKTYSEDMYADAYCWCIYANINSKLKDFNTALIAKIRTDLSNVKFE
ncbi:MAG: hypothetical protein Q8861_09525 [Bacteroidota bacterium]|nr:hypothetical protein [Bacteroidota bacterium]